MDTNSALLWLRRSTNITLADLLHLFRPLGLSRLCRYFTVFGCDTETGTRIAEDMLSNLFVWYPKLSHFKRVVETLLAAGVKKESFHSWLGSYMLKFSRTGNLNGIQYLHRTFQLTPEHVASFVALLERGRKRQLWNVNYIWRWLRSQGLDPGCSRAK